MDDMREEIESLQRQLNTLRRNLNKLEEKHALYGELDAPIRLLNDIDEHKTNIERVEARLRQISVTIPMASRKFSNLPHATGNFVGRQTEIQVLLEKIESRWPVICIEGIGGIGKTSLAIEVGHMILDQDAFDGVVWISAKNSRLTLNDLLNTIARTLDREKLIQLSDDEKLDVINKLLGLEKILLIIDNFETVDDERILQFVLEIRDPSKALITSRQLKIPSAWLIHIKGMSRPEGLALIRLEAQRLDLTEIASASDTILARLYEKTGGVPLAIKWSLGQIRQKGQSLDRVLSSLYNAKGKVFETIFGNSFKLLSLSARHVLRSILVFSAPASRNAIAKITGIDEYELDEALDQLVEMLLVDVSGVLTGNYYDLHPLTRAFARKELLETEGVEGSGTYLRWARYFQTYLHEQLELQDRSETYKGIDLEQPNIVAALNWCYENGQSIEVERESLWSMFVDFVEGLSDYLWARGYWTERIDFSQRAYDVCLELKFYEAAGKQAYDLGWVYWERNDIAMAQSWAEKCLQSMQEVNRPEGLSLALHLLGLVAMRRAEYAAAEAHFTQALDLAPSDRLGIGGHGSIMSELGHLNRLQGKLAAARDWYERCLNESERSGYREGIGISKGYLAQTLYLMGDLNQAEPLYQEALTIAREVGRATTIARIQRGLAELYLQRGAWAQAAEYANEAIPIYRRLDKSQDLAAVQDLLAQAQHGQAKE